MSKGVDEVTGKSLTPFLPREMAISLKRPLIASKSKSRLVTPLFYGCHLNFMVGHASPLEDSPQIGIWIVQQDAAIHGQKASFIRIAW